MRHKIASIAQSFRLPTICSVCNQYHPGKHAVCADCYALLTPLPASCRHCAMPLPDIGLPVCGHCVRQKPAIDTIFTAYRFEEPLRTLLHEFKYRHGFYLLTFMTQLIRDGLSSASYDTHCLIPIPMHRLRIQQRGFNHAAELTKQLSRQLSIPYDLSYCKKIRHTPPQAGLNSQQRQKNIQHAFLTKLKPIPYKKITLIDDLLTTGNTANELAKTLKLNGAAQVDLWCCART